VKLGLGLPLEDIDGAAYPYPVIREMALGAEEAGLDSIWVYDHLLFRDEGETTGIHECWTILSALAEATSRVELGTLVMCTEFRNPALLAKMAATLDHVSGGRMILGLGCGWHDPEYEAFGYPTDHKVGRFDDSITIIHSLIRTGHADHDGRFHAVDDVVLLPAARPDLPILVAAKRPRMMDLTARYADAWNLAWFGLPNERLANARADLLAACGRMDRDPATLEVTVGVEIRFGDVATSPPEGSGLSATPLPGDEASIVEGLRAFEAFGASHLIFALDPSTPETAARLNAAVAAYRRGI
jgi:alkanesulfonate monooxygenase SsuD/methylene tetrahydromethanopterin reductase-like flavin-dependent oxidoreductase (luciferase family)